MGMFVKLKLMTFNVTKKILNEFFE